MRKILSLIVLFACLTYTFAQDITPTDSLFDQKMEWFADAKLGIFIHWGIYAVKGIGESWSFFNEQIPYKDYAAQTKGFTAAKYDPQYWADLIKQSGAKYCVITAKHHDGFALWDTKYGDFNVMHSAAGRDVLTPFIEALRRDSIKVGLYFSLIDWSYPDYPQFTRTKKRYEIKNDSARWKRFLHYYQGQLMELKNRYHPDLWWFDGDWEHSAAEWQIQKVRKMLSRGQPMVIFNSRMQGYGDYATPEIGAPVLRPKAKYWELCMTMNDSWGYQPQDTNYKSVLQIIDIFTDVISKGGNLLLDFGPKADGTVPESVVYRLTELGKWIRKHSEAIYGTRGGIPCYYFCGPTTISKDSTKLYLFVRDIPKDNQIILKGISTPIKRIYVVGTGKQLTWRRYLKVSWNSYPGVYYIKLPKDQIDKYYTVVAVELDGKLKLYGND